MDLNLTMRSSFIKNYNNFSNDNKKLNVDRLTLFILLDKTEWFVLWEQKKNVLLFGLI